MQTKKTSAERHFVIPGTTSVESLGLCKTMGLVLLVTTWLQCLQLFPSAKMSCTEKKQTGYVCQGQPPAPDLIQNQQEWERKWKSVTVHVGRSLCKCEQERLHHKFRNMKLLNESGNWRMLGLFCHSFTIKNWTDREELVSSELPPLPLLQDKVSSA